MASKARGDRQVAHLASEKDETIVAMRKLTYRMYCISVGNSPSYKAATLFDTDAHASFVEEHGGTDRQVLDRKRHYGVVSRHINE